MGRNGYRRDEFRDAEAGRDAVSFSGCAGADVWGEGVRRAAGWLALALVAFYVYASGVGRERRMTLQYVRDCIEEHEYTDVSQAEAITICTEMKEMRKWR